MKKLFFTALMCVMTLSLFSQEIHVSDYVDLGLPSRTLWRAKNESGFYSYDDAVSSFGDNLPAQWQFKELVEHCTWTWTGSGYKIIGKNGHSIFLPITGAEDGNGNFKYVGEYGFYWSSTPMNSEKAWNLCIGASGKWVRNDGRIAKMPVRLVRGVY